MHPPYILSSNKFILNVTSVAGGEELAFLSRQKVVSSAMLAISTFVLRWWPVCCIFRKLNPICKICAYHAFCEKSVCKLWVFLLGDLVTGNFFWVWIAWLLAFLILLQTISFLVSVWSEPYIKSCKSCLPVGIQNDPGCGFASLVLVSLNSTRIKGLKRGRILDPGWFYI